MDNFLLEAVARELRAGLTGRRLEAVRETASGAVLLLFGPRERGEGAPRAALLLDPSATGARLHLARARHRAARPDPAGFAARIVPFLVGRRLEDLEKDPPERLVRLVFSGRTEPDRPGAKGPALVAELIGRSANLLLVGESGEILAFARRLSSEFRRPGIGKSYEPPPPPRSGGPEGENTPTSVFEAAAPLLEEIERRARRDGVPLAEALRARLSGLPAEVAADVEREAAAGGGAAEALLRWTRRIAAGDLSPVVYSETPLESLPADRVPGAEALFALPLPLSVPPAGLTATAFPSANEAAEAMHEARARAGSFVRRREALAAIVRKERARMARLLAHLEEDLARLDPPGACRRKAEALLAGMAVARREGEIAFVPDPYDETGAEIAVTLDPSRSLQQNAEALFQRERKAERGRGTIARRLERTAERSKRAAALEERIAAAREPDALAAAEAAFREIGLVLDPSAGAPRPRRRAGAAAGPGRAEAAGGGAAPRLAGIRAYRSSDGFEILVGRTGKENDRLTFRIAAPEDFWFHAAGAAGAHVVVRNPQRLEALPERTARQAAALAARFSRAAGGGKVEVHATRRKYVRRARRAPPGTVLLKRFKTLLVAPAEPPAGGEGP